MPDLEAIVRPLNPPQREAALHRDGPLLVMAGAGAGKTSTVTHRLACLLARGVPPEQILCITFTNKAAREMRERAAALGGRGAAASRVPIRTFHAAGLRLLREGLEQFPAAGRRPDFGLADPHTALALIREAIAERNFDLKANPPESFLGRISRYKNELADPQSLLWRQPAHPWMDWPRVQALLARTDRYVNRLTAEIWQRYEAKLRANNLVDFDDLIGLTVRMLVEVPELRHRFQERWRYLQVDEFQDTNVAQLQMVKLLAGPAANVLAVGDDFQSIYSWRSADIRCILEFEAHFPGARVIKLEQNYRSTAAILRAASRLIACNPGQRPKTLYTTAGEGAPVTHWEADDASDEARWVAAQIRSRHGAGRRWSDFAILCRTNAQMRPFEEQFRQEGIPCQVEGGPRFLDRREVQDALAWLRVLDNPRDSVSLERVLQAPRRGLGEKAFHKVLGLASRRELDLIAALAAAVAEGVVTGPAAGAAQELHRLLAGARDRLQAGEAAARVGEDLIRQSGLLAALAGEDSRRDEHRADSVGILLARLHAEAERNPGGGLAGFLERLALQDAQDDDSGGDAVRLVTIHAAKGLEFPEVFVVGMEQGILPNRRALDEENLEEERRLCYVAFTRARERLYLTSARVRREGGEYRVTVPSQFLRECQAGPEATDGSPA